LKVKYHTHILALLKIYPPGSTLSNNNDEEEG
jgi:hypothetical protein